MSYINVIRREYKPKLTALKEDIKKRKDPHFFWPNGTQVYCGKQGSGKTISAVKHVHDIKARYPQSILVSNLLLKSLKPRFFNDKRDLPALLASLNPRTEYVFFQSMTQLEAVLVMVNNGFKGVIYLIDEIHTYFNALESKNIPMFVFTEISQQRKQRKCIIGTSQLFLRMAKPFREQCDNLIVCTTLWGFITTQTAYDGMSLQQDYDGTLVGNVRRKGWFFHTPQIRKLYDTYQKVVSGQEQYESSNEVRLSVKPSKNSKIFVK